MLENIRNQAGEKLDTQFEQGSPESDRLVILGHGVTGNKDRPVLVSLAQALAEIGIATLRMSFSGNGDSEGTFDESTISKEVEDLRVVVAAAREHFSKIAYVGHSMGGAVGVIAASGEIELDALVSLAGMVHVSQFAEVEFGEETSGFMWGETDCPLSETYLRDCQQIGSLVERGGAISIPWLLIHGKPDDTVPINNARDIFEQAGPNAKYVEMPEADHVFSGEAMQKMTAVAAPWLNEHLK
ncbi:MAG: alpha/beta fold hydrolase [Verrucomicrobiota bacterium]